MTVSPKPLSSEKPMQTSSNSAETLGTVVSKLGVAWAGFFVGLSLSDWVLLATLIYTLLNIALLIVERVIKPIRRRKLVSRMQIEGD